MTSSSDVSASYDSEDDYGYDPPSSPSKSRRKRRRQCLCCMKMRESNDDVTVLPSIHKPERKLGVGLTTKICTPFLFMLWFCLSFLKKGGAEMKSRWRFPFLNTLANAAVVFGVFVLIYELYSTSRVAQFIAAAIAWVVFLANLYRFFRVGLPMLQRYLGSTYGAVLFFDLFLSQSMSYAALGFSIWILDTSPGKSSQFLALGDETVSGYLAFMRLWVSTASTLFGPGHIPNLPVGVLALVWNFGSVINSVFLIIVVGAWATPILDGMIPERKSRRRRGVSSSSSRAVTPRTLISSKDMEIPDDSTQGVPEATDYEYHSSSFSSSTRERRPPRRKKERKADGIVEIHGSSRWKDK